MWRNRKILKPVGLHVLIDLICAKMVHTTRILVRMTNVVKWSLHKRLLWYILGGSVDIEGIRVRRTFSRGIRSFIDDLIDG